MGNSLRDRVLIVLRGARQELSSPQIARVLGLPTQVVTSPVSKLVAYGDAEVSEVRGRERFYRAKERQDA